MRIALPAVLVSLALVSFVPSPSAAWESEDGGLWTSVAASGSLDPDADGGPGWRWNFDGHARFFDETDGFGQSIVRPSIGYALDAHNTVWLGYAWIRNNRRGGSEWDEHRVWQQWSWRSGGDDLRFSSRLRLEQRVVRPGAEPAHRVRERFRLDAPTGLDGIDLIVHDELFLGLNSVGRRQKSGFDQNRLFVGAGFGLGDRAPIRFEVGYLNQYFQPELGRDQLNHILSINLVAAP